MKVTIDPAIQTNATLTFALERVDAILATIFRKLTDEVEVRWSLAGPEKWSPLYFQIQYEDQGTGATIQQAELGNADQLKAKLRAIWGDLLRARTKAIIHRMQLRLQEVETTS